MRWDHDLDPLPEKLPAPQALATFNARSQAILDEWLRLQLAPAARRAESPNAWFKREAYRLLTYFIAQRRLGLAKANLRKDNRSQRAILEVSANPFKLGLMAMFADETPLSRNNRHVFGNQMLYAWTHDVPPEFLNAFLAISGGPALIARKLKDKFIEPGFEHRFHPERAGMAHKSR